MQRLIPLLVLMALFVFSTIGVSQVSKVIEGNGQVISTMRDVKPFTKVRVEDGWELILSQGNHYEMRIEADSNFQPHLQIIEKNGTLKIHSDAYLKRRRDSKQTIYLTFKALSAITGEDCAMVKFLTPFKTSDLNLNLSDGAKLEVFDLSVGTLKGHFEDGSKVHIAMDSSRIMDIWATDGSNISFEELTADTCHLNIDDGAKASFSGSINFLKIRASDNGTTTAPNLSVKNGHISLSEFSNASLQVEEALLVELFEKSTLTYSGNPTIIKRNICSSCTLTLKK